MQQIFKHNLCGSAIALSLLSVLTNWHGVAIAQIIPDSSLGSEHSVINQNLRIRGQRGDRIDGGAIRGSNLFHSFSDFNINQHQRVYFSNPAAIDTIISRVTGHSQSDIFGTLGVLGHADLFFINPNGIVFGPNAVLDINGSFVASTTDRILLDSGYTFSASEPNAPPLLHVADPVAGLQHWLPPSGTIQTQGNLSVGDSLGMTAETLAIQGQLSAGGDINLAATNQLSATDSSTMPLMVAANQNLLLQGNQSLEILALDHASSGLTAGGTLTLRSDAPIVGDAVFQSGGNIQIERLDGRLGPLLSIDDPVFQTAGDFAMDSYSGASLQILAGGSVTIPGGIAIDSAGGPFNDGTVELSNGESLTINGSTEPTVDIRAGTTQFFGSVDSGNPTSADILVGQINNPGGLVHLTNQFQPNPDLSGDINASLIITADESGGGSVFIDSKGEISFNVIDTTGGSIFDFDRNNPSVDVFSGRAGDVILLAAHDIIMPFVPATATTPRVRTVIFAYGTGGGNVTLKSDTAIIQESAPFGTNPDDLSQIESVGGLRPNGNILLSAPLISIGGAVQTETYGNFRGGNIRITADRVEADQATILTDTFRTADSGDMTVNADAINLDFTLLGTATTSDAGGQAGDVTIRTNSLTGTRGAQIGSAAFVNNNAETSRGGPGTVDVAADTISLSGFQPDIFNDGIFAAASIFSSVEEGVIGDSGAVQINTRRLELLDGAAITTSSFGVGSPGRIEVNASESIVIDGAVFPGFVTTSQPSKISSEAFTDSPLETGRIVIRTGVLEVTNGGTITTTAVGQNATAGSIQITATESALFDGVAFEGTPQERISGAVAVVQPLSSEDGAIGNAGSIDILTPSLVLSNRGRLLAASLGSGRGGDITVQGDTLVLNNGAILAITAGANGGDIDLRIADAIALTNGSRISATAGTALATGGGGGDGGNIEISSTFVTADPNGNNDITANAFTGEGGRVEIGAEGIFGLTPRSRAELEQLLGTTDPTQLTSINLPSSDITAISQSNPALDGVVIIRSPDVDPSRSINELPTDGVDASRLIAQGCSAGGAVAQEIGSLIVTGRGGLPENPAQPLNYQDLALEWARGDADTTSNTANPTPIQTTEHPQPITATTPLVEVQALTRQPDGQVILTAQTPTAQINQESWATGVTCVGPVP